MKKFEVDTKAILKTHLLMCGDVDSDGKLHIYETPIGGRIVIVDSKEYSRFSINEHVI